MTNFFKVKRKLDSRTEVIARTFNELKDKQINKKITPSEIAKYLGMHPNTVKDRISSLEKEGYLKCKKEGNKTFCEVKKKIDID